MVPATTSRQLKLFEDEAEREKLELLERAADDIRRRFGHYAIYHAVVEFDLTLNILIPKRITQSTQLDISKQIEVCYGE